MGLRINTNIASITAQRYMNLVTGRLQGNYARLASGLRIASAADDAAGLGVSERMRAQIRSYVVAGRNAQDGISLAQVAEGSLSEVSNILVRMRELAVQAANGAISDNDRAVINTEFTELISEVDRIASSAEFNGVTLLDGSTTQLDIQVGIDAGGTNQITLALVDSRSTTLGVDSLTVDTSTNAEAAITALDTAIDTVVTGRGTLGAEQNRMQSAYASIQILHENMSAAESRIRDVDIAMETADLTRNSILQQAAASVLAQANVQPQLALGLLA